MARSALKPGVEITHAEAKVVAIEKAGVVVALRWQVKGSEDEHRQYQALRIRDGLVFEMQDYRRLEQAQRAVR